MANGSNERRVLGFKKFSDIKKESKSNTLDNSLPVRGFSDSDIPMNPNLPKPTEGVEKMASTKRIRGMNDISPKREDDVTKIDSDDLDKTDVLSESGGNGDKNIQTIGKVAKFPKNTKASKAYNFLENVKVSKKSIWYIMIEKQDNELQMVKYNFKEGVDLNQFVNGLKEYYVNKFSDNENICKLVENIKIDGNDKYSYIRNIPTFEVGGKKIITKITEDLINLLSK
jgi:hypothetical protein